MGFADKLRSTINKVSGTVQTAANPLPDETSRKYYEIVYGLLSSVFEITDDKNTIFESDHRSESERTSYKKVPFDGIKKCVEFHIGESCDDELLSSILSDYFGGGGYEKRTSYFRYSRGEHGEECLKTHLSYMKVPTAKAEKLIEINSQLDSSNPYMCSREELYNTCFKDIFDEIKAEFVHVLDVVEDRETSISFENETTRIRDNNSIFLEGLTRIRDKYEKVLGETLFNDALLSIAFDSFWNGKPFTKKCFLNSFYYQMAYRSQEVGRLQYFASIALRAVRFEKYGKNKSDYTSIADEECRDFILTFDSYENALKNHPFDRDDFIGEQVKEIQKLGFIMWLFFRKMDRNSPEEIYLFDYVCNLAWKDIASMYEYEINVDAAEITHMLFNFALNFHDEIKT